MNPKLQSLSVIRFCTLLPKAVGWFKLLMALWQLSSWGSEECESPLLYLFAPSPLLSLFKQRGALSAPCGWEISRSGPIGNKYHQMDCSKYLWSRYWGLLITTATPFFQCCLPLAGIPGREWGRDEDSCNLLQLWKNCLTLLPSLRCLWGSYPIIDCQWVLLGSSSWNVIQSLHFLKNSFHKDIYVTTYPQDVGKIISLSRPCSMVYLSQTVYFVPKTSLKATWKRKQIKKYKYKNVYNNKYTNLFIVALFYNCKMLQII